MSISVVRPEGPPALLRPRCLRLTAIEQDENEKSVYRFVFRAKTRAIGQTRRKIA